jgi:5'(3')-deoxyribonucleotidase
MRLGIDLDGVVADFNSGWIRRYNVDFGTEIPLNAVESWDGMHQLTHFPDINAFWEWAQDHGGGSLFRHLETYDGAVEALHRLYQEHDIVIVTTKPEWAIHDTLAWLAEHRIPTREVHMIEQKWRVPCDVYLDDSPHQVQSIHHHRPEAAMCRFVRPWNDPVPGVHNVENWATFEVLVDRLAAEGATRSQ